MEVRSFYTFHFSQMLVCESVKHAEHVQVFLTEGLLTFPASRFVE